MDHSIYGHAMTDECDITCMPTTADRDAEADALRALWEEIFGI